MGWGNDIFPLGGLYFITFKTWLNADFEDNLLILMILNILMRKFLRWRPLVLHIIINRILSYNKRYIFSQDRKYIWYSCGIILHIYCYNSLIINIFDVNE